MPQRDYFPDKEMKCPCCGKVDMSQTFKDKLNEARSLYGKPMTVSSGYRCKKHNAEVGGKLNSAHLTGEAADIQCVFAGERFKMLKAFYAVGFSRIGISFAGGFIHVDTSETLPQEVCWPY
jgi:zinc D-Ala-D-Ala carboxypeptidase